MDGFGQKLKELRKAKRLTRVELAKRSGLSTASIREYERSTRRPTLHKIHQLSTGLQLTFDEHVELRSALFAQYITGKQTQWSQFSLDGTEIGGNSE